MSVINTNLQSLVSARNLNESQETLGRSLNRLSSVAKLTKPSDSPAALAVSKKMDALSLRVNAAATDVQNAISYVQAADSQLNTMMGVLARLGELAGLANDPTTNAADVSLYLEEFASLQGQLRATIGGTTVEIGGPTGVVSSLGTFNGMKLFGPGARGGVTVGSDGSAGERVSLPETNLRSGGVLNIIRQDSSGTFVVNATDQNVQTVISVATAALEAQRATLAAAESRLNLAGSTLKVESENLSAAMSSIGDAGAAEKSTQLAKFSILAQSGTAMRGQANQAPQSVLKLLQI